MYDKQQQRESTLKIALENLTEVAQIASKITMRQQRDISLEADALALVEIAYRDLIGVLGFLEPSVGLYRRNQEERDRAIEKAIKTQLLGPSWGHLNIDDK